MRYYYVECLMEKLNVIIIILIKFHNSCLCDSICFENILYFYGWKLIIVMFFSFFNFFYLLTNFIKQNNNKKPIGQRFGQCIVHTAHNTGHDDNL